MPLIYQNKDLNLLKVEKTAILTSQTSHNTDELIYIIKSLMLPRHTIMSCLPGSAAPLLAEVILR